MCLLLTFACFVIWARLIGFVVGFVTIWLRLVCFVLVVVFSVVLLVLVLGWVWDLVWGSVCFDLIDLCCLICIWLLCLFRSVVVLLIPIAL